VVLTGERLGWRGGDYEKINTSVHRERYNSCGCTKGQIAFFRLFQGPVSVVCEMSKCSCERLLGLTSSETKVIPWCDG
jgi:hypothetical protein